MATHAVYTTGLSLTTCRKATWKQAPSTKVTFNNTGITAISPGSTTKVQVDLVWRTSNLQLNSTAAVPMQLNSLQYDIVLKGYMKQSLTSKVAICQILSMTTETPFMFDVNHTPPVETVHSIKSNKTYGILVGNHSDARLEYPPEATITDLSNVLTTSLYLIPESIFGKDDGGWNKPVQNDWIQNNLLLASRQHKAILVSFLSSSQEENVTYRTLYKFQN